MKVLFLTNIPSPYRVDFFQELGKACELTVLYELPAAQDRNEIWKHEISDKSYREIYLKPVMKQTSSAWCPSVTRYLRDRIYDIIVVGVYSTPTGMQAIRYLHRHGILYWLNCDGGLIPTQENALKRRLKTSFIRGAVGYLSTGRLSDEYLIYYGAEQKRIRRYPFASVHAADVLPEVPQQAEKQTLRTRLGIREKRMILTAGNFIPRKGFDILLEAAGRMNREYGIYLVGGEETSEYREIRERLQLGHVHYIPFLGTDELRRYYRAADLFVLPTREDIWGLVIGEAMAAGLPVVTTNRCAAGVELLQPETIVPTEDPLALAETTECLLENDTLRGQTAQHNLDIAREYTIEAMAQAHRRIWE